MKGTDLEAFCREQGPQSHCIECPVVKKCNKWKKDRKKLATMEPWELEAFITLTGEMVHAKEY